MYPLNPNEKVFKFFLYFDKIATIDCESKPPDKPQANGTSDKVEFITDFSNFQNCFTPLINIFTMIWLKLKLYHFDKFKLLLLNQSQVNVPVVIFLCF